MALSARVLVWLSLLLAAPAAWPATYYVDFEAGSDAAAGLSRDAAWKHCPGDAQAAGVPAGVKLAPGDTVRFKGGVAYRSTVTVRRPGAPGKPILYDGNSDGAWGEGRASVDGSESLRGWERCRSAEECGGCPNWQHVYTATLPAGVQPGTANLCEGDRMLWLAQDPPQPDPLLMDKIAHFHTIANANVTTTSITDAERLTQADEHAWDGAWVMVWVNPNVANKRKITGFVPAEHRILFDKSGDPYRDREEKYALYNHPRLIGRPGEYAVVARDGGPARVFLWPLEEQSLAAGKVTVSVRTVGFDVVGGSGFVTIQGFHITKQSGAGTHDAIGVRVLDWQKDTEGVTVRGNLIDKLRHVDRGYGGVYIYRGRNCLIEENRIEECPLCMGILCGPGVGIRVRRNVVRKAGAQSIWFMGCKESEIVGNEVTEGQGTHANGISVYLKCDNILVAGNRVFDSNIAFTLEQSEHVTLECNVFHGAGVAGACVSWGGANHVKAFHNVFIGAAANVGLAFLNPTGDDFVVKDNILAGFSAKPAWDVSHNLYTGKIWDQGDLRQGELMEADLKRIFVDPDKRDFHLKAGSPAIGAGTPVDVKADAAGAPWPAGKTPDIGAYVYKP